MREQPGQKNEVRQWKRGRERPDFFASIGDGLPHIASAVLVGGCDCTLSRVGALGGLWPLGLPHPHQGQRYFVFCHVSNPRHFRFSAGVPHRKQRYDGKHSNILSPCFWFKLPSSSYQLQLPASYTRFARFLLCGTDTPCDLDLPLGCYLQPTMRISLNFRRKFCAS